MVTRPLADALVSVVPKTMQLIRAEIRRSSGALSLTQFRILARLRDFPRTNAELAAELGVSDPAMSRQIQTMVEAGWVDRVCVKSDRRCNRLSPTRAGDTAFLALREHVVNEFERRIESLDELDRLDLKAGLDVISNLLSAGSSVSGRVAIPSHATMEGSPS
ncbi:MAG: MarR family transcriptional regulator [Bdellovibrionales bacterium]|nr:MarR family transcriptional regulator [Bdellovibrionales bacterium]